MNSDVRHLINSGVVEWRIGGHITAAEVARAYDRLLNDTAWKTARHLIIIIERDAGLGGVTVDEIRAFQAHLLDRQPVINSERQRRVAYVCENELHIGLLELHRLTFDQHARIAHNHCEDLEAAHAWVSEAEMTAP